MKNVKSYIKYIFSKVIGNMEKYKNNSKIIEEKAEKIFYDDIVKHEYKDYIRYILSEEFKKRENEFQMQAEDIISDRLSVLNKPVLYTYIALAVIFIFQIIIFLK
jgi:cell shape-determining protein MreC